MTCSAFGIAALITKSSTDTPRTFEASTSESSSLTGILRVRLAVFDMLSHYPFEPGVVLRPRLRNHPSRMCHNQSMITFMVMARVRAPRGALGVPQPF